MKATFKRRDISLDFVRGLAILLVLRWHMDPPVAASRWLQALDSPFARIGWAGVDMFFVLSGFLIGGLLMREANETSRIDVKRFLERRAYKIWPAYFFYLAVASLVVHRYSWREIAPNLVHLQNYLGTPLKHTWSLAVEEHFYILLCAALAGLAARKNLNFQNICRLCFAVMIFCPIARLVARLYGYGPGAIHLWTHTRIDTMALGILLAAIYRYRPATFERFKEFKPLLAITAVASVVVICVVPFDHIVMTVVGYDIVAAGSAAFLLLVFLPSKVGGPFENVRENLVYRGVAAIGFYSYGIYLWQGVGTQASVVINRRIHLANGTLSWLTTAVIHIAVAVAVGVVATKIVELPFLKIRERFVPPTNPSLAYPLVPPAGAGDASQ